MKLPIPDLWIADPMLRVAIWGAVTFIVCSAMVIAIVIFVPLVWPLPEKKKPSN